MSVDCGGECGTGVRHALGFAAEIHRRCVVNGERVTVVAASLGLDYEPTLGVFRIVRHCGPCSPERLAVVAMKDWGMTDADIASMFRRTETWARVVRAMADEIRRDEPIPEELEYLDAGLQKGDPSPEEIAIRAAELRAQGIGKGLAPQRGAPSLRYYRWERKRNAFISLCPE